MMTSRILVTGATGNLGRCLLEALADAHLPFIAATRHPSRPIASPRCDDLILRARKLGVEAEARAFDFAERDTWADALKGVEALFLLRPPAISDVEPTLVALTKGGGLPGRAPRGVPLRDGRRGLKHHPSR